MALKWNDRGEVTEWNPVFAYAALELGFTAEVCWPYRVRDCFFYGRQFANDADLNEQAERWLERTANVRRHGTTGERPVERFERDEREALHPLAHRPYQRLGAKPQVGTTLRRLSHAPVEVERRPLSVYAEAVR